MNNPKNAIGFNISISNIQWDADDMSDVKDLDTSLILPSMGYYIIEYLDSFNDEDTISDMISNRVGFTHKGFDYEIIYQY